MSFCIFSKDFKRRKFTEIENNFLLQFLPEADNTALKVYLLGLYICQNIESDTTPQDIAAILKCDTSDIVDSFMYWEDFGLVNVLSKEPLSIEYLPLDSAYKSRRLSSNKYSAFAKELQLVITERLISPNEFSEYFNILENYSMAPEAMILIVKYCVDMKGGKINYRYITTVIKNYAASGILTYEQVEKELSDYVLGADKLLKIYSALNLDKKAELEDQALLKKWLNEYSFEFSTIVFTAQKIKGGIKKLDSTLSELYFNKRFSEKEIEDFLKNKKKIYDFAFSVINMFTAEKVNIAPYLENYFSKWFSKGYDENSIMLLAKVCFKRNKKSLEDVDILINSLYEKGIVSFESIAAHFNSLANEDNFILKYFEILGLYRKPTAWDRQNLRQWRQWNFSEEMIIEAAKRSVSASNPIPYMNAILSKWKAAEQFSVEQITDAPPAAKKGKRAPSFENKYSEKDLDSIVETLNNLDF